MFSITLVVEEDRSCVVSVTSSYLHISKPILRPSSVHQSGATLHCGTKTQPWLLEAPAGQRINISLLDFTPTATSISGSVPDSAPVDNTRGLYTADRSCIHQHAKYQYGYVIDKSAAVASKKNITICNTPGSHRLVNVHLSTSNVVELVLHSSHETSNMSHFLIRIEGLLYDLSHWIQLIGPTNFQYYYKLLLNRCFFFKYAFLCFSDEISWRK